MSNIGFANQPMPNDCIFCRISSGSKAASVVAQNDHAMAFVDLRQHHPGHTLVIPRKHVPDVRGLDYQTGAELMAMVSAVTAAVGKAFPNQGLSLWHSIGKAAFQEVLHLHIHIHPRLFGDGVLRVYPEEPANTARSVLERYAASIRDHLHQDHVQS